LLKPSDGTGILWRVELTQTVVVKVKKVIIPRPGIITSIIIDIVSNKGYCKYMQQYLKGETINCLMNSTVRIHYACLTKLSFKQTFSGGDLDSLQSIRK